MSFSVEVSTAVWEPADVVIHIQEKGVVLREKSLVAFQKTTGKILAIGTEAEALAGRASEGILVISPFRQGRVADYLTAVHLFTYLLAKAGIKRGLRRPAAAVCVPEETTQVEKKALEEALMQSGVKEAVLVGVPLDQFLREQAERYPELHRKCRITIGITKEEPERYIVEALGDVLKYARQEGILEDKVAELLRQIPQTDGTGW